MSETTNIINSSPDHDLLIELRTEVRGMRDDVKDLKDNMSKRVTALEGDKFEKVEAEKMKSDIQWLKGVSYTAIGALAAAQFYFQFLNK